MATLPDEVAKFLSGKRFAVAGVSRQPGQAANAVLRKLRDSGREPVDLAHRCMRWWLKHGGRVPG